MRALLPAETIARAAPLGQAAGFASQSGPTRAQRWWGWQEGVLDPPPCPEPLQTGLAGWGAGERNSDGARDPSGSSERGSTSPLDTWDPFPL